MNTSVQLEELSELGVESRENQVDILDLLLALSSRRKLIFGVLSIAAVVATAIAFLLPQYFEARTTLLPPQPAQSTSAVMAGQISAITGISARELGAKNPVELYVALLSSESVTNALVERFRLREVYGKPRRTDARTMLAKHTVIGSGKDGLITVVVEDRDPRRAADIANGYVEELQRLNGRLAITEAAQRRLFFEQQLEGAKTNLLNAELELGETERKTGVVEVGAHAKALVEQIAVLRGQLAAKEVQIRSMQSFATEQNPDYRLALQEASALRSELARLERGSGEGASGSMTKLSGSAVKYSERYREVKYQETLFDLLARQYEAARIDEAKEGTIIQVVDRATPAEKRSWPNRGLIVLILVSIAGFGAAAWVLVEASFLRALEVPSRAIKIVRLRELWKLN